MSASLLDIETKRKLREMNAADLLTAIDGQDPVVSAGMPFEDYFAGFADLCAQVDGRPHWGKMHPLGADELSGLYPRFDEVAALRREVDPAGRFLNGHLRSVFGEG